VSDKTEDPTPRRLKKAREEGDSPVSGALVQSAGFVVAMALAPAAIAATAARVAELLPRAIHDPSAALGPVDLAREVLSLTVPLLAGVALVSAAAGFVQTGGAVGWKKLSPDLSKLDPIRGLRGLVGAARLFSLVRALLGAAIVAWLALRLLQSFAPDVANTAGEARAGILAAGTLARRLGWIAALIGLGLAFVDLVVVRRAWIRRNRMTKDEVKREHKESEGDPELKAARHRAHQEVLTANSVAAVREATVLVVNPTHRATALHYDDTEDESAPRVVARGEGDLARRMIEAAQRYGVPVVRDVPLSQALSDLEVGDEIPEALYEAVAEILKEIYEAEA
jgi:flagellar biosynthesis protein FlhB